MCAASDHDVSVVETHNSWSFPQETWRLLKVSPDNNIKVTPWSTRNESTSVTSSVWFKKGTRLFLASNIDDIKDDSVPFINNHCTGSNGKGDRLVKNQYTHLAKVALMCCSLERCTGYRQLWHFSFFAWHHICIHPYCRMAICSGDRLPSCGTLVSLPLTKMGFKTWSSSLWLLMAANMLWRHVHRWLELHTWNPWRNKQSIPTIYRRLWLSPMQYGTIRLPSEFPDRPNPGNTLLYVQK